jgi:H-type small acid-soluble spore protein
MLIDRALEVLNSTEKLRVLYSNQPVWIESINTNSRMATVRIMGTNQLEEVYISELTDTGSKME